MAKIKNIIVPGGLGDATPEKVIYGYTFTSDSGINQTGSLPDDTAEVTAQTPIIEQILAALGGAVDPQPAVANALTASGGVYLTVMEE